MSRRQSRSNKGSKSINESTGLEEPFPSCPTRQPKYGIYCSYPAGAEAGNSRKFYANFCGLYAAKHFVNEMLGFGGWEERPFEVKLGYKFLTIIWGDNEVELRCPQDGAWDEILNYEFTAAEAAWQLPDHLKNACARIRSAPPERDEIVVDEETGKIVIPPKKEKPKKEPKPEKVKIDKSGLVSVGDIAEQMDIEARDARGALRKAKMEKPTGGWLFPPDKVEEIKKVIKKHLK